MHQIAYVSGPLYSPGGPNVGPATPPAPHAPIPPVILYMAVK